ncbi:MAG: DMT family transporter [Dongiaceae bacterium]
MNGSRAERLKGLLLLLGAMAILPVMDAMAKHLSGTFPLLQITWARFFFHFLLLVPVVLIRHRLADLWPQRPLLQILRGGLLLASTFCFFGGVSNMPLADTLAIFFISPLIVTLLAPKLLGEQVGMRRKIAVLIGFIGAMVIIRPGLTVFQPAALFPIASGLIYALYTITTRKLAGTAPPFVTAAFTALLGAIVTSAIVPFVWVEPTAWAMAFMVSMGLIAATGHLFIVMAYERAEASLLAPLTYSEMISMVAIGYAIFGDFPDFWTLIGIVILVGSGTYISIREHRAGRRTGDETEPPSPG